MITLNNLPSPIGSSKNRKRIGRGQGSGQGTQAGKGNKGQKARKSRNVRIGFEAGLPLYMRLPKRGFNNTKFAEKCAELTLERIERTMVSGVVNKDLLVASGLLRLSDKSKQIKIIAKGSLTKAFKFSGIEKFSKGALDAILKSGGSVN